MAPLALYQAVRSPPANLHLLFASSLSAELDQGRATAVTLDTDGAFDSVRRETLITKLGASGIDGILLPLLMDYT